VLPNTWRRRAQRRRCGRALKATVRRLRWQASQVQEALPRGLTRAVALTITIIGAGPLGRWLAQEAARAGYNVFLRT